MSNLDRSVLSSDIATLRSTSPKLLQFALSLSVTDQRQTPLETLQSFSPSTATPASSQSLAKAYIQEMRQLEAMNKSKNDQVIGDQIDRLRAKGEEMQSALEEIKV
ncbi:uncharacterized protein L203_103124 [Cryptococcus depauperatus CBS 7841]|uniref:Uncharacterized protein n=1 Tax=Cryptococcus depauperatus CBS 7841 TaxID=1295531 RepID=A0A1E3IPG4_9TREE|nr:hypothetical protein L203_01602 [Cryptococcus depauperatus CBS 7841]